MANRVLGKLLLLAQLRPHARGPSPANASLFCPAPVGEAGVSFAASRPLLTFSLKGSPAIFPGVRVAPGGVFGTWYQRGDLGRPESSGPIAVPSGKEVFDARFQCFLRVTCGGGISKFLECHVGLLGSVW